MNQSQLRAPWEYSKVLASLVPAAGIAAAVVGASIDRTGYTSLIADHAYAASGAPTSASLSLQLQDSADGVTFANYGPAASESLGASGTASLPLDCSGARQFIRVVATPTFTGGNNPTLTLGGTARLFGPDRLPAA